MTGKRQARKNISIDQILVDSCNRGGMKKSLCNRGGMRSSKMSKGRNALKRVGTTALEQRRCSVSIERDVLVYIRST